MEKLVNVMRYLLTMLMELTQKLSLEEELQPQILALIMIGKVGVGRLSIILNIQISKLEILLILNGVQIWGHGTQTP